MGEFKPSTVADYLAGQSLEIEPIWGEPLRRGKAAGLALPGLEALYQELRALGQKQGE
jgi:2-dehydropantoate 2-reductase